MIGKQQFFSEVIPLLDIYDRDNQWFGFKTGGKVWSQGQWPDFVLAAWKLYENASKSALGMVLLGDTKIRSDSQLLMNFGLVSNSNSPQEEKDKQMVSDLIAKRHHIAAGSAFKTPIPMMGPGSILSAERWSPLLNDSLMLGSIRGSVDFQFALNVDEQPVFLRLEADAAKARVQFEQKRAVFGNAVNPSVSSSETQARELWLKFLNEVPRVLWEWGTPRVFVRELLGLRIFGYKPYFHKSGLLFSPSSTPGEITFRRYLNGLQSVGLEKSDRQRIMAELSTFLFDDPKALQKIGA